MCDSVNGHAGLIYGTRVVNVTGREKESGEGLDSVVVCLTGSLDIPCSMQHTRFMQHHPTSSNTHKSRDLLSRRESL